MAEERAETREQRPSWTNLLGTFLVALDPFKLLMAAAGILTMAVGWWLISVLFYASWTKPKESDYDRAVYAKNFPNLPPEELDAKRTTDYQDALARWAFIYRLAGPSGVYDPDANAVGGRLRTMPWFEERGPNPFRLGTAVVAAPEERREVFGRFLGNQLPVLIEPLVKFLTPVLNLFDPHAGFWGRVFLLAILLWMLIVWAFFGGVITRMAVVQFAGREGGGLRESIRFVLARYPSYLFSPLVPLGLIAAVTLGCVVFGLFHLIPLFGDLVVDGLFWPVILGAGFVMAMLLVGLVGYPLMYSTLSAEGSDTFDALSRSYNYVYESPWHYLWYSLVAVLYGAVVVLFVVFMTSLMVYLGKWGVSQTPFVQAADREPSYLFVYAPTSFGWRDVLLRGSEYEVIPAPASAPQVPVHPAAYDPNQNHWYWYNYAAAGMVAFWLGLAFMLMIGFAYSYFWSAATMIYLLMRRRVDETEIDEIYAEDEEPEEPVAPPRLAPTGAATAGTAPAGGPAGVTMVEPPTLRTPPAAAPPPPPPPPPPAPVVESPPTPPAPEPPPGLPTSEPPTPPVASSEPSPSEPMLPPAPPEGDGGPHRNGGTT